MNRTFATVAAFLLLLLPAGLFAQSSAASAARTPGALNPGDVLRVEIWREKELSGDFLVDESGSATLPLLGEKKVTGMQIPALRASLVEAYREHLRNPSISITPMRRLNVLGNVMKPGVYIVDPTVTLAEAVSMAGGATPNGRLERLQVVRGGQVIRRGMGAGQSILDADVRSGDQVVVPERTWLSRNSAVVFSTVVSTLVSLATVIAVYSR